jgi:hypothetical protein
VILSGVKVSVVILSVIVLGKVILSAVHVHVQFHYAGCCYPDSCCGDCECCAKCHYDCFCDERVLGVILTFVAKVWLPSV